MPKGDVMLSSKGAELVLHALKAGLKKFKRDEIAYPVIENAIQLIKLAAPEGEKCAHWPGQKRCEVCGMGKVKP